MAQQAQHGTARRALQHKPMAQHGQQAQHGAARRAVPHKPMAQHAQHGTGPLAVQPRAGRQAVQPPLQASSRGNSLMRAALGKLHTATGCRPQVLPCLPNVMFTAVRPGIHGSG